jgi:hypothetical protein
MKLLLLTLSLSYTALCGSNRTYIDTKHCFCSTETKKTIMSLPSKFANDEELKNLRRNLIKAEKAYHTRIVKLEKKSLEETSRIYQINKQLRNIRENRLEKFKSNKN